MTQREQNGGGEEGVEVPWERLDPETLRSLVREFVTREWEELGDVSYTLEQKVEQVLLQLRQKRARLVFDARSGSCNIVPHRP
jgi:uncharacterized protein YheU (UPF0270 family)